MQDTKQFDTHVCLVSAQAAPNLLPLLDDQLKPRKVLLLVTPPMKERAQWLTAAIKPLGITVHAISLPDAADFSAIQEHLLEVLAERDSAMTALNATGGTKWMAIAAAEVFRSNKASVFYVDMQTDRVLFLDKVADFHPLKQQIKLQPYLQAYGYRIVNEARSTGLTEDLRQLCQTLVKNVVEWESAIGNLNALASEAEKRGVLEVGFDILPFRANGLDQLLKQCRFAGLLELRDGTGIRFADADARGFANGGWLEYYVNTKLNTLKGESLLQDSAHLNVEIENESGTKNELDIAFMARNHLHIIECKTRRMEGSGAKATDALYKLDSITDLGGLATRSMLVSYRKLNNADRQRAKDLRIKVIEGVEIQQLKPKLEAWIGR